ncbi:MAG: iron-containing alcohol dehydrogenase [Rhodovibrionaceae bacterium]|nr:iron-containing alcohol dehydrogenase [Rhodovibrionaceae bacterium]
MTADAPVAAAIDPASLKASWSYPTTILFGPGRIRNLARACAAAGIARPLLVTDPGLAALPAVQDAVAANEAEGLATAVFAEVKGNPVGQNVEDGVAAFRAGGHDGVIAFGGGSALDAGKAIAFAAAQDAPIWEFEDRGDLWKKANAEAIAPVIAVPTTAGTGSEVGRASVILDERDGVKKVIFHPRMLPVTVISDPELTVGLPAHITAATGMDALAHCLEAYCAPAFHPMSEGIAVEGLRLIREWLPRAVEDGADVAARAHMLVAASMGSVAFQKGLGAIHAMSHPVGAAYDTHHGLTNACVMPYVLAFNRPAIEGKMQRLAAWLELPGADEDGLRAVLDWTLELRRRFGVPHTLAEMGVEEARLPELVAAAAVDPTAGGNPVALNTDNLAELFDNAMAGRLP